MSRTQKILLGILTCLPFIFFAIYLTLFLNLFFENIWYRHAQLEDFFFRMFPALIFIALMAITKIGLMIYYIIHAVNNPKLDGTERVVWILIFLFVGLLGFPTYWYMRIWKDEAQLPTAMAT